MIDPTSLDRPAHVSRGVGLALILMGTRVLLRADGSLISSEPLTQEAGELEGNERVHADDREAGDAYEDDGLDVHAASLSEARR